MTTGVPTLDYPLRRACGKWVTYADGARLHVVSAPAPLRWQVVVGRTLKGSVCGSIIAALLVAAASEPMAGFSWAVFAGVGFWLIRWWRRLRRGGRGPDSGGPEFIAGPDGLAWHRPGWTPWTFSADAVASVRLHLSPPARRRTHPVSVVLALANGERHVLDYGTLEEGELLADAIEQGLGLRTPDDAGTDG